MSKTDELCSTFETRLPIQEAFTQSLSALCRTIIESGGIEIQNIEARTKTVSSLKEKINRPDKLDKYEELDDVTDLTGIRVILFLQEDCDKAIKLLGKNLKVDKANSTDKDFGDDADRFGYASRHLVVSHTEERCKLKDFKAFKDLKAEIQVRTVLQHAWAAIDWRLRYKSESEVPRQLRRRLYRISALLESADDEFSTLELASVKIRKEYTNKITQSKSDIPIDGDSIKIFLSNDPEWLSIIEELRKHGVQIHKSVGNNSVRISLAIELLGQAGYSGINDIRSDLKTHRADIIRIVPNIYRNVESPVAPTFSPEGILRISVLLARRQNAESLLDKTRFAPRLLSSIRGTLDLN